MKQTVLREHVKLTLMPDLELIANSDLREKVVDAWTLSCLLGGYKRLEDVPTECFEQMPNTSNIQHQKETTRIAVGIVRILKEFGVRLNEDYVAAGALCHDVGKPIEFRNNQRGIFSNATGAGTFYGQNRNMPSIDKEASYQIARHPLWGLYVAVQVGMPDHVVHIIASHSHEGEYILRSREALIVKMADNVWWEQVAYQILGGWADIANPLGERVYRYRKLNWRSASRKPKT
jgi:putative nucleotidyltransferase with HDIG domain